MAEELTPKQIEFLKNYNDPKSETFSNALQSALKAGYSQEYAESILCKDLDWMAENVGRRKRMLAKAEARLETAIDSDNETEANKVSMFIAKTIGKDEGYSDRTEVTGKDGGAITVKQISYGDRDNDTPQIRAETIPVKPDESSSESAV